jgi:hypothetical protein
MSYLCRTSCKVYRQKQARIIKGTRGNWILQCPACACERRTKTAAMCLGNIIATYGSQSIQSDWHEGWQKGFKNKNRKHHKSRSKRNTLNRWNAKGWGISSEQKWLFKSNYQVNAFDL